MTSARPLIVAAAVLAASSAAFAQGPGPAEASSGSVAASVDGRSITWDQVQRQVDRVLRGREATPEAMDKLRETAREQLISRQLILSYLRRHKIAPSDDDIDVEVSRIRRRLAVEDKTLEDYLTASQMTAEQLRALLEWQLGWQWYLDRYMTDANLEKYFEDHRVEFDGSQLRVSHILFQADPADADALGEARREAEAVRAEIAGGKLTFADAARQHSDSPTADKGGDLGFIGRHEPMPESFSKVAFSLAPDEVSQPVTTAFGVHLIQRTDIEPGQRRWQETRAELEQAVTAYLFQWVADQQRPRAEIHRATTGRAE